MKRGLLFVSRIFSAICTVFSLFILILSINSLKNGVSMMLLIFIVPVVTAMLIFRQNAKKIFIGGLLNGVCGIFVFVNQLLNPAGSALSQYLVCGFALFLLLSGIMSLLWYRKVQVDGEYFTEFKIEEQE